MPLLRHLRKKYGPCIEWNWKRYLYSFYENFLGHRFETQIHIQTQIRLNTILTLATNYLMIINKDNLYIHLKAFYKNLVSSCCECQSDIPCFTMSNFQSNEYPWKSNFSNHINWNKKPLTRSTKISENLTLKFPCDVILQSLLGQSDIPCFAMSNFQSDEYPWKQTFLNHIRFILKTSN